MADRAAAYDSRDIVENFLRHKLLKKGLAWPRRLPAPDQPAPSSSSSSSSSSSEGARTSRRRAAPPPGGEDDDSRHAPPPSPSRPPCGAPRAARLHEVLRQAGDELEQRFRREFLAQMSALLVHWEGGSVRPGLAAVREELLRDGVNWGRIVALLELCGILCVEAVKRRWAGDVDDITGWMVESLEAPPLRGWIEDNGGWDAFVQLYDQPRPVSIWTLKTVFGLVVLGVAGITLGVLLTQK